MGVISIRRIILDNITSRDESEVRNITKIVCDKYNIPMNDHIENMIKDICGIEIAEKVYSIHELAQDFNVTEKQIRRKLRNIYGNCNGRWIVTQTQYEELKKRYK